MDTKTAAFSSCMEQEQTEYEATTNQTMQTYKAINERLRFENEAIKACCDSQAIQQSIMQQQLTEQSTASNNPFPDSLMETDNKQDTPATPTTMSNSPRQISKKIATNIVPKNLLDSMNKLQKHRQPHQSPAQSRSLTAINETAQGIPRNSPGRKPTTTATSYAKETTGGNKK
jgi:hypothetical protein